MNLQETHCWSTTVTYIHMIANRKPFPIYKCHIIHNYNDNYMYKQGKDSIYTGLMVPIRTPSE